jgi:hypothetical protein
VCCFYLCVSVRVLFQIFLTIACMIEYCVYALVLQESRHGNSMRKSHLCQYAQSRISGLVHASECSVCAFVYRFESKLHGQSSWLVLVVWGV